MPWQARKSCELSSRLAGGVAGIPRGLPLCFQCHSLGRSLGSQPPFLRLTSGLFSSFRSPLGGLARRFRFPGSLAFSNTNFPGVADRLPGGLLVPYRRIIRARSGMESLEGSLLGGSSGIQPIADTGVLVCPGWGGSRGTCPRWHHPDLQRTWRPINARQASTPQAEGVTPFEDCPLAVLEQIFDDAQHLAAANAQTNMARPALDQAHIMAARFTAPCVSYPGRPCDPVILIIG